MTFEVIAERLHMSYRTDANTSGQLKAKLGVLTLRDQAQLSR